jgi:ribA/ribD-fused uncharacterized protein
MKNRKITAPNIVEDQSSTMENQKYHFFWRKVSPLSQWHPSVYNLDGYTYTTAEQGMMHGKALLFGDEAVASQILTTNDPRATKGLGRKVRGFTEKVWKRHRERIVYNNNKAKFTQNAHLREALLNTTGLLVEASPSDTIWGIGLGEKAARKLPEEGWKGLNLMGKILVRVRYEILISEAEQSCANEEDCETSRQYDSNSEDLLCEN